MAARLARATGRDVENQAVLVEAFTRLGEVLIFRTVLPSCDAPAGLDNFEPVPRTELLDRLKTELGTIVDVRPEDEFALGHVTGAINNSRKLQMWLAQLEAGQEIWPIAGGLISYCSMKRFAALRARSFKARRLKDGMPERRAAGLPVEAAL